VHRYLSISIVYTIYSIPTYHIYTDHLGWTLYVCTDNSRHPLARAQGNHAIDRNVNSLMASLCTTLGRGKCTDIYPHIYNAYIYIYIYISVYIYIYISIYIIYIYIYDKHAIYRLSSRLCTALGRGKCLVIYLSICIYILG